VIGEEWLEQIKNSDIVKSPPTEALQKVIPEFRAAGCDVTILVAQATLEESRVLGEKFSDFDIVVTAGGQGDPAYQPEQLDAGPLLIRVGDKAMFVGLVGFFGDQEPRFRYQRLPLSNTFKDSQEMLDLLASYQDHLKQIRFEGLGLRPLHHPSERKFVGSEACAECHPTAYEKWSATPHAHATDSLRHPEGRALIERHFDPECLSCHVTGWNPQNYYPYISGYLGLEQTPHLVGNGCENCHGPGSEHVAAELGEDEVTEEIRSARQAAMVLPLSKAEQQCMECHDLDNSPNFHVDGAFAEYWKQIEHYEEN
jgi:hypothetical protein